MNADSNSLILLLLGCALAVYAIGFWVLSIRYPAIPLVAVFAFAPFQNDLSGLGWLHFSMSELHLLLAAPLMILRGWQGGLGWLSGPIWGTLILATILTIPTWRESSGISLIQMGLYWVGAVALVSILPTRPRQLQGFGGRWTVTGRSGAGNPLELFSWIKQKRGGGVDCLRVDCLRGVLAKRAEDAAVALVGCFGRACRRVDHGLVPRCVARSHGRCLVFIRMEGDVSKTADVGHAFDSRGRNRMGEPSRGVSAVRKQL